MLRTGGRPKDQCPYVCAETCLGCAHAAIPLGCGAAGLLEFVARYQHEGWIDQHVRCGYAMTTLLLFRLIWGFAGSDTARFARFLKSPVAAWQHLADCPRGEPDHEIGHNAAGGWMVLLMLGLL